MENHFGNIWGKKRPKIDKTLFISEMDTNDSVHKLDADTIMKKIIDIKNFLCMYTNNFLLDEMIKPNE